MALLTSTAARDATSLASTSSGNTNTYVYDVFISHRGPDSGLASDIYNRLVADGFTRVFLDKYEMQIGENIGPQIQGAIRTASVHVPIFSQGYADSKWCLSELVLMVESKSTILPVFYNVEPSNLRWTEGGDGVYAQALRALENKRTFDSQPQYNSITIKKWRDALSTVANISGFELKACNNDEGQLVNKVVQQVLKLLTKYPKYPTGLDENVKDFEKTVFREQQSDKARVVGIAGLGGVGKTTLATEFFYRHRSNYARSCFLHDVRENAAKGSLNSLQSTLLKDLAGLNEEIKSAEEGKGKLKSFLSSSHQVLVVLDDVDHIDQMEALFSPVKDIIHSGSLIVVTSRNRDVLTGSDIPELFIYGLRGLNPQYSKELFCLHAFGDCHPIAGFAEVVEEFLNACDGLPLSLTVLGALLRGNEDLNHWEAQLRKIRKMLPGDIQRKLRLSYDSLDEKEKNIFLDIACFFIGEDKDTAINIWDGSGWEGRLGLWKLLERCLVEVDSENQIRMHDHLRELGRDLAEKEPPGCELRLWRPTGHFLHNLSGQSRVRILKHSTVFQHNVVLSKLSVRGIILDSGNGREQFFENVTGGCNLSRLQLLRAQGDIVERLSSAVHLPQLIYLRWSNCPFFALPSLFSFLIRNLRVLNIEGMRLKTLWQHESEAPLQLRELYISGYHSFLMLPKSIGKLKHLKKLALHCGECRTGGLSSLQSFDLRGCLSLQALPDSVGDLSSLQSLDLRGCSSLQALPDSVGGLSSLQSLDLRGCSSLQALPDSVGGLSSLQSLDLRGCSSLQALPDSVGGLWSLQSLDLRRCSSLQALPDSVGVLSSLQSVDLSSLQSLDLSYCSSLQALPDSVGDLSSLQSLDLNYCSSLQALPDSVGDLSSLQSLDLSYCSSLQALPDSVGRLRSLQSLNLTSCFRLQGLPHSVANLTSLRKLNMRSCSALKALPD